MKNKKKFPRTPQNTVLAQARLRGAMGKKGRWIDASRLAQAGEQNAERLRKKLAAQLRIADTDVQLTCVYQGTAEEEAPLNSTTKVTYHWTFKHGTVIHTTAMRTDRGRHQR